MTRSLAGVTLAGAPAAAGVVAADAGAEADGAVAAGLGACAALVVAAGAAVGAAAGAQDASSTAVPVRLRAPMNRRRVTFSISSLPDLVVARATQEPGRRTNPAR